MKNAFLRLAALALFGVSAATASALGTVGDGCYQLVIKGSLLPVLCIQGSNEEGIGGGGARVAQIGPNGGPVLNCLTTTRIQFGQTSTTFAFANGSIEMIPESNTKGRLVDSGPDAISEISYFQVVDVRDVEFLLSKIQKSGLCDRN